MPGIMPSFGKGSNFSGGKPFKSGDFDPLTPWAQGEIHCLDIVTPTLGTIVNPNDRIFIRWKRSADCPAITPLTGFTLTLVASPIIKGSPQRPKMSAEYQTQIATNIIDTEFEWITPVIGWGNAKNNTAFYIRVESKAMINVQNGEVTIFGVMPGPFTITREATKEPKTYFSNAEPTKSTNTTSNEVKQTNGANLNEILKTSNGAVLPVSTTEAQNSLITVSTIPSSQTWYTCSNSIIDRIAYNVTLLDGEPPQTTNDIGKIDPGYPTHAPAGASPGFITIVTNEIDTKKYLDPNFTGQFIYKPDASCYQIKPIVPVKTCRKEGLFIDQPTIYCLAITNPMDKAITFLLDLKFNTLENHDYKSNNPKSKNTEPITGTSVTIRVFKESGSNSNKKVIIIGIVVGTIFGLILLLGCGLFFYRRYFMKRENMPHEVVQNPIDNSIKPTVQGLDSRHTHLSEVRHFK
ncbi:hypothetical protein G9A89_004582 [Geosiphon pyriformis]|nr:hypothetical protein G9A89_004582 [Geosiphon pyriformis]